MRRSWELTLGNERGSALLIGLFVVAIMSLLGVALFEMGTIEAGLVTRGDVWETQNFYCAEAALAYTYNDLAKTTEIGALAPGETKTYPYPDLVPNPSSSSHYYTVSVLAVGRSTVPTITATCKLAWGTDPATYPTRTVQLGLHYTHPIFEFAVVSGDDSSQAKGFGNFYLGGTGAPTKDGGNYVGGADTVNGDIYVSGTAALRGAPLLTPCHSSDCDPTDKNPQLTAIGSLLNTSTTFDRTAPGAYGTTGLNPMPDVASTVASIRAAVSGQMTGTYNGSPVYNLTQIFATLGVSPGGNIERNLKQPDDCVYGQAAAQGSACQVWQDLLYVGVKSTTTNPGPTDYTSYYFMGVPRSPGLAPEKTPFPSIYSNLVNASAELQQMGFTPNFANLGVRLDALAGQDTATFLVSDKKVDRLVDLSVGTNDQGQAYVRGKAPIFFIDDGYFRVDDSTNYAYNGIGTVVTSKSIIISDNVVYLNGNSNKNPPGSLPGSCANINDRTNCGLADVLGLVAQYDIWVGDAGGTTGPSVEWVSGVMLAGRDFNYFDYTSNSACCQGPANPVTLNGTVMASRQVTMARDWSDPQHDDHQCNSAGPASCKPVQYFPNDSSCGVMGCWKYLKIDTMSGSATFGALIPDSTYAPFAGCETTEPCKSPKRRITHFQLNARYERRLYDNAALIPPGLPTRTSNLPPKVAAGTWKDCGAAACP